MTRVAAMTGLPFEAIRRFLDSRHGRHFADSVYNYRYTGVELDAAIDAAIREWGRIQLMVATAKCQPAA
ncbi:MAG: hypothetical protein LBJ59_10850 [Zoogloeaceae bacterium]|jgi:hypothetical protein|nr:hypothetical protein [Zoogloeaceae bacterium]